VIFGSHELSFLLGDLPFILKIVFVANQNNLDVGVPVGFDFLQPVLGMIEGFPP